MEWYDAHKFVHFTLKSNNLLRVFICYSRCITSWLILFSVAYKFACVRVFVLVSIDVCVCVCVCVYLIYKNVESKFGMDLCVIANAHTHTIKQPKTTAVCLSVCLSISLSLFNQPND